MEGEEKRVWEKMGRRDSANRTKGGERRRKGPERKLGKFGALLKPLVHFLQMCLLPPAGRQGGPEVFCRT